MDWQAGFNFAIAVAGVLGGWLMRVLWDLQKGMRTDLADLQRSLPNSYVRRDDFKDTMQALFQKLDRIEGKLDGKADKE